jgi:hypothetical protein
MRTAPTIRAYFNARLTTDGHVHKLSHSFMFLPILPGQPAPRKPRRRVRDRANVAIAGQAGPGSPIQSHVANPLVGSPSPRQCLRSGLKFRAVDASRPSCGLTARPLILATSPLANSLAVEGVQCSLAVCGLAQPDMLAAL